MTPDDRGTDDREPEDLPPPRDAEDGTTEEDYELVDEGETAYADVDEPLDEPLPEQADEPGPDEAEAEVELEELQPDDADAGPDEAEAEAVDWYQNRWRDIQISFVDEPRNAVANADRLVADVIQQLTTALAEQRNDLAAEWSQDGASTEDLRRAFRGYRSFFERLVAT